tara:strand:- start:2679 stop:3131 length:453 start_codon:yes stop_codon:yes gene_type:complete
MTKLNDYCNTVKMSFVWNNIPDVDDDMLIEKLREAAELELKLIPKKNITKEQALTAVHLVTYITLSKEHEYPIPFLCKGEFPKPKLCIGFILNNAIIAYDDESNINLAVQTIVHEHLHAIGLQRHNNVFFTHEKLIMDAIHVQLGKMMKD